MKLRNKITIILVLIWSVLILLAYFGTEKILLKSYLKLEDQNANESMVRIQQALSDMLESAVSMTGSWAVWDDTYQFILDHNKSYINSNLTPESFSTTNMDMVLYFNNDKKLVAYLSLDDSRANKVDLPKGLLDELQSDSKVLDMTELNENRKGFLSLPSGLYYFGASPIVTSKNTGPLRGTLIMVKLFNSDDLTKIISITKNDVSITPINKSDSLITSYVDKIRNNSVAHDLIIKDNESKLTVYSLINDINGKPVYLIANTMPRNLYILGKKTIFYYSMFVIFFTLILGISLWFLLQMFIVNRINTLGKNFTNVKPKKNFLQRLSNRYEDEVSKATSLYYQATHDPLTGLGNRNLLYKAFEYYSSDPINNKIILLFFDLNKFKEVNDTLGHDIGDELLVKTADRISASINKNDVAVRLGGDEFVIMLLSTNELKSHEVIAKIFDELSRPVFINHQKIQLAASIGASIYPDDANNISTLLKYADIALYKSKEFGSNNFVFYCEKINQDILKSKYDEVELQSALSNNELLLYFQPIYDAKNLNIVGIEVLLRWQHPRHGLLPAQKFIELANRTGLIVPIGNWVLNETCKAIKYWQELGLTVYPMTVNLSARQIAAGSIDDTITKLVNQYQIDYRFLELEISEVGFIKLLPDQIEDIKKISAKGVKISIDDFGISYSKLGILRYIPNCKLKIDHAFVIDIETSPDTRAIITAIISFAHQLQHQVVAKGVENQAQYNFLSMNHVDAVQGFFFSMPLEMSKCEAMLRTVDSKIHELE